MRAVRFSRHNSMSVRSMRSRSYWILAGLIIAAGLGLRWPLLRTGFIVDDYAQLAMMKGEYPTPRAPLELFTFSNGSRAENARLRTTGFFPWWSDPTLRVSLFRPLASALMWFDLRTFGVDAYAFHLHSACWWLAMMVALAAVLRCLLPPWAAWLALVVCTAHPVHNTLLGWIANRNAIVATTFGLLGLLVRLRAHHDHPGHGRLVAVLCHALSLSASEYGLSFFVYGTLFEWERAQSLKQRAARLMPWLALFAIYASARSALGFGARGSGMYIDPLTEPLAFLREGSVRLPVLAGDVVFALRSNWWSAGFPWINELISRFALPPSFALDMRPARHFQVECGWLAMLVAGLVVLSVLRSKTPNLRFIAFGFPLSLIPALGSFPESRLLLPALFGWCVLLAHVTQTYVVNLRSDARVRSRVGFFAVVMLWVAEGLAPPLYSRSEITAIPRVAHAIRASILAPGLDPFLHTGMRAFLMAAVDPTTTIYIPLLRRLHGRTFPDSCQLLTSQFVRQRLERLTANSFALERIGESYTPLDVYGSAFNRAPFRAGQRFQSRGMKVTVERVSDNRPTRIRYELDVPLDGGSVVLLAQTFYGVLPVPWPVVGQSAVLEPPALPMAFMPHE